MSKIDNWMMDKLQEALDEKRPKCVWTCNTFANPSREYYHRACDGMFSAPTAAWKFCPVCGGEIVWEE